MILSILTAITAATSIYFGSALLASNVDIFYIFLMLQVFLIAIVKIAHHSSETSVRVDRAGGLFILFASSAMILLALQGITNSLIFKGIS